jgi:hypothetical protein
MTSLRGRIAWPANEAKGIQDMGSSDDALGTAAADGQVPRRRPTGLGFAAPVMGLLERCG